LAVPDKGRERRLAAKVRVAAKARGAEGSARRLLCRRSGTGPASGKESDKLSTSSEFVRAVARSATC